MESLKYTTDMARKDSYNMRVLKAIVTGVPLSEIPEPTKTYTGPTESEIQQSCIEWFRWVHRDLWEDGVLFHIPNEGIRLGRIGSRMKREGIVRGVADLCLALPRHGYGALYIEMKRPKCYQSPEQKTWQKNMEKHGNKYAVVRSRDEFEMVVNEYLAG